LLLLLLLLQHCITLQQVTDIRVITDRHTKRSKGLAYVEFKQQEQVFVALAMTGQILLGQPVMVKPAEAEKNLAWEAQQAAKQGTQEAEALLGLGLGLEALSTHSAAAAAAIPQSLRLQITGFKPGLAEGEIKQIFEPFGPVDSVSVVRDGAGQPISIAYVVFRNSVDGTNAMQHWHGKSLLDHVLNVTVAPVTATDKVGAGGAAVVGELDDDDFKLNTQVGMDTDTSGCGAAKAACFSDKCVLSCGVLILSCS
jgi:RNA-binding protein 39